MNDHDLINAIEYSMRRSPIIEEQISEDGVFEIEIYEPESLIPFCKALLAEIGWIK